VPATSIAWGAWGGGGMVEGEVAELLAKRGVRRMRPESAVKAMAVAAGREDACVAIASLDLDRFLPLYTMARPRRLVAELAATHEANTASRDGIGQPDRAAPDRAGGGSALADRLTGLSAAQQDEIVLDVVRREAATVLDAQRPSDIRPRRAFKELGFDSLTALEFRNRLNAATGLKLPATLVFDHPAPALLASWLRERLTDGADGLLVELARMEAAVAAGGRIRGDVADRLRALLNRAAGPQDGTGALGADGADGAPDDDLAAASDDEIFDLIDRELGIS
jgi:acyl carrier protein